MRRTVKDIQELYECYCRCWQHEDLERVKRLEKHGWVEGVWVRDYDDVVRMASTDRGSEIVSAYYDLKSQEDKDLESIGSADFLDGID